MTFTVAKFLALAKETQTAVDAGHIRLDDEVYTSLEVVQEGNEATYDNRVHGGEAIQLSVANGSQGKYVHIQLIGTPNFEVYK